MNTQDYLREGYKQSDDRNYYQKLQTNISQANKIVQWPSSIEMVLWSLDMFYRPFHKIICEMVERNLITPKMAEYLTCTNPKPGRFYLFPKIHKKASQEDQYAAQSSTPTTR
jgi:aspartate/methionine/tyrosine aminotransferase